MQTTEQLERKINKHWRWANAFKGLAFSGLAIYLGTGIAGIMEKPEIACENETIAQENYDFGKRVYSFLDTLDQKLFFVFDYSQSSDGINSSQENNSGMREYELGCREIQNKSLKRMGFGAALFSIGLIGLIPTATKREQYTEELSKRNNERPF